VSEKRAAPICAAGTEVLPPHAESSPALQIAAKSLKGPP